MKEAYCKGNPDDPTHGQTPDWIAEAMTTWCHWTGYSGAGCGKCNVTVNVMNGPGWFCPSCGDYNCMCFYGGPMPVENPTWGPTLAAIRTGGELARLWTERKRRYIVGDLVWLDMRRDTYSSRPFRFRLARVVRLDKENTTYHAGLLYYNLLFMGNNEPAHFPQANIHPVLPKHRDLITRCVWETDEEILDVWELMDAPKPAWARN